MTCLSYSKKIPKLTQVCLPLNSVISLLNCDIFDVLVQVLITDKKKQTHEF